jgi:hypothetical protein
MIFIRWVGGKTVVVQVGDQLDRGDDELAIIELLEVLKVQADKVGGGLHILVGNHETMNAQGNFLYATDGAMEKYDRWHKVCRVARFLPRFITKSSHCSLYTGKLTCGEADMACKTAVRRMAPFARARYMALRAGGMLSKGILASHPTVLVVGDTVFVHGGLSPSQIGSGGLEAIHRINDSVSRFLAGASPKAPSAASRGGVLWMRCHSAR